MEIKNGVVFAIRSMEFGGLDFQRPGLALCKLSSDSATVLLRFNSDNRPLRRSFVEYLKSEIAGGKWRNDHPSPVVISNDGRLVDGQHRLTAIAESGLSESDGVWVRVETGAQWGVREYVDSGVPRTLSDRVDFVSSDTWRNRLASQIVRTMHHFTAPSGKARRVTPNEAKAVFNLHREAINWISTVIKKERGTGQMAIAIAAVEYWEKKHEKADEFYRDLFVPAGSVQQAQMLRNCALTCPVGGDNCRRDLYGKAVSCMKAHLEGRDVRLIRAGSW